MNASMARFGNVGEQNGNESEEGDNTDTKGTGNTDTNVIRTNRKLQSKNPQNIQTNINRENAKTVQSTKSISSPIGHENSGK